MLKIISKPQSTLFYIDVESVSLCNTIWWFV